MSDLHQLPIGQKRPLHAAFQMISGTGDGPSTTNSDLATALVTVGIPLLANRPFEEYGGDVAQQICYYFEEVSTCGEIKTRDMIAAWEDFDGTNGWNARNPNHPFAYAAAAVKNRSNLIRFVRDRAPLIVIREGNTHAILRAGANKKYNDQILSTALRLSRKGWHS